MKVVELIARALYLSGIAARGLDVVQSDQGKDGLFFLNLLLSEKSMTDSFIPYISHLEIPTVVGQQIYFVNGLISIDAITFSLQTARYSLRRSTRRDYFGSARAEGIESLPYHYYAERANNGTNIYLYFLPEGIYPLKITGKSNLASVTYDDELNLYFEGFYQSYLMYQLAKRLCDFYLMSFPPQAQEQLEIFEAQIRDLNPMDVSLQKLSTLDKTGSFNYAQANLGKGWTTG